MYLGIDFLITSDLKPCVVEVNVGLPGGAQEYHLTHLVHFNSPSDVFDRIELTSQGVYGKPFKGYLRSLPFIENLKSFKIWMDGMGPFPDSLHSGLRLEDKWIQHQLISPLTRMPETMIFDPLDLTGVREFLERKGRLVLKRRLGRGGRGLQIISNVQDFPKLDLSSKHYLLQEYIDSRVDGYTLSIRSVAFGGEFICMYANLSTRSVSNHGFLTFVSPGEPFGLAQKNFKTTSFNQKSWEAKIWFGDHDPPYLRHNLYEDEVAQTTFYLPEWVYEKIKETSVKIERFYESLDLSGLPKACFEK
jgi:hypothetical protein